ncbi:hypothetical protein HYDPIDRAFT_189145 [Hydnomerulius pinastri MD-312]|uniref:Uncharacterized protein n=1 Tax=Hydnomerulius pinastri MD-312 TaxID=994086 RepID=A0A0C9VVY6_9AGAM|nr:hypothetical protein HYDPIDRAFT_189145 [Hydnomerulius pinastri MD-312]
MSDIASDPTDEPPTSCHLNPDNVPPPGPTTSQPAAAASTELRHFAPSGDATKLDPPSRLDIARGIGGDWKKFGRNIHIRSRSSNYSTLRSYYREVYSSTPFDHLRTRLADKLLSIHYSPAPQLQTVEVFCEAILYGVYSVLAAAACYILISGRAITTSHKLVLGISIFMYCLATSHLVLVFVQSLQTEVSFQNTQTRTVVNWIMFMCGDGILIWRAWIVWSCNIWVAIVPSIILILFAGKYLECRMAKLLEHVQGQAIQAAPSRYRKLTMVLCESGALLATIQIISLVLDEVQNEGLHVMDDICTQLVGILPTLIALLVHFDMISGNHVNERYADTLPSTIVISVPPAAPSMSSVSTSRHSTLPHARNVFKMDALHSNTAINPADRKDRPASASETNFQCFADTTNHTMV